MRDQIKQATRKNLSLQQAEQKATLLLAVAEESYPAIRPEDVRCKHLKQCAKRLLELKKQKKEVIDQMVVLSQERKDYQVLLSFPGIGAKTAVRLLAELGDLRRFQHANQINAYAGIDIQRHQSGKLYYPDKINKRGNRKLRNILYMMILSMICLRSKTQNTIVDYYDKLKKQPNGKIHKVAVIACMNKFLKVAFHLIQHGIMYQYEAGKTS